MLARCVGGTTESGNCIEQRRARVTIGPLPAVVADRTSMEQVMSNLLNNFTIPHQFTEGGPYD